jgi:hypothetical protein
MKLMNHSNASKKDLNKPKWNAGNCKRHNECQEEASSQLLSALLLYYDVGQLFCYYYKSTYVSYTNDDTNTRRQRRWTNNLLRAIFWCHSLLVFTRSLSPMPNEKVNMHRSTYRTVQGRCEICIPPS